MPFIQITMGVGRTPEQKDRLVRAVSKAAAESAEVPEASVRVWLVEVPPTQIMAGGETLADKQARAAGS